MKSIKLLDSAQIFENNSLWDATSFVEATFLKKNWVIWTYIRYVWVWACLYAYGKHCLRDVNSKFCSLQFCQFSPLPLLLLTGNILFVFLPYLTYELDMYFGCDRTTEQWMRRCCLFPCTIFTHKHIKGSIWRTSEIERS